MPHRAPEARRRFAPAEPPLSFRLQETARGLGVDLSADSASVLVDLAQGLLLLEPAAESLDPTWLALLAGRLAARLALPEAQLAQLLRQAWLPEHRSHLTPLEMAAFEARFGSESLGLMLHQEDEAPDLAGFARRHGSADALLLLDMALELKAASGNLDNAELSLMEVAAGSLGVDGLLFGSLVRKHVPQLATGELRFSLASERISIGRDGSNDVILLDPQVAPRHASLVRVGEAWRVVDEGSGRPTVVNGEAVASAPMGQGDEMRIGPYALWLAEDGGALLAEASRVFSALSVRNLRRVIKADGRDIPLLSGVSFTVYAGEVVAVAGPSGCGKTTLLNAITAVAPPDSGEVLLDGADFHRLLAHDRSLVGMVPQDDLVHADLDVEEALAYAARLRFPTDVTPHQVDEAVNRVMETLDIQGIARSRVGNVDRRGISGGQRKRVNLGQELVTRSTRILFLDEPTSGLDPRGAQDIVRLIRRLADDGRIIFLVTHDLSPSVLSQVDHLMVMAPGGHMAFFGPPDDAAAYFGVETPDALFHRLEDHSPAAWQEQWKEDPGHLKYVAMREFLVRSGGISEEGSRQPPLPPPPRSLLRDLYTQTERYVKVKLRDRLGDLVLALQPPLLALVMFLVFPEPTPSAVFMLALSSLWFGMSSSVRELIADRPIWRRERRVGARLLPYLGSKVLVLGTIVTLQCVALAAMLHQLLDMGGHGYSLATLATVQALTGLAGMALGLLVSSAFTSSEAAVGTLPLLLVPQIVFSSIMVPIRHMGDLARGISWVTVQRYALDASIKAGDFLQEPSRIPGRWERYPISGPLYSLGLKPPDPDHMGLGLPTLCAALLAFTIVFLAAAALVTRSRDGEAS